MTGDQLEEFIHTGDVQFMWGVFSAFSKGMRCDVDPLPFADGNQDFWNGIEIGPQLATALFEIVAWDSSATLLIGLPENALARFQATFPQSKPLKNCK